jgi:hypothetical protein
VLQATREKAYALYRRFKDEGFAGSGIVVDSSSLFVLLPPPAPLAASHISSDKKLSNRAKEPSLLPSSGVRKRHDPRTQLIAKSKKKALAEFMKLREGISSGEAKSVMSPRAAAKLLKMSMMRSK